jgi:hypothetical protein
MSPPYLYVDIPLQHAKKTLIAGHITIHAYIKEMHTLVRTKVSRSIQNQKQSEDITISTYADEWETHLDCWLKAANLCSSTSPALRDLIKAVNEKLTDITRGLPLSNRSGISLKDFVTAIYNMCKLSDHPPCVVSPLLSSGWSYAIFRAAIKVIHAFTPTAIECEMEMHSVKVFLRNMKELNVNIVP